MNPNPPPRQSLVYSPYALTPQDYADALQSMRRPEIRTAGALGTNLLAEALDQYGKWRAAKSAAGVQDAVNQVGTGVVDPADQTPGAQSPGLPNGPYPGLGQ